MTLLLSIFACASGISPDCRGLATLGCTGEDCVTVECDGRAQEPTKYFDAVSSCEISGESTTVLLVDPDAIRQAEQKCNQYGYWYEHWFPAECSGEGLSEGTTQVMVYCAPKDKP